MCAPPADERGLVIRLEAARNLPRATQPALTCATYSRRMVESVLCRCPVERRAYGPVPGVPRETSRPTNDGPLDETFGRGLYGVLAENVHEAVDCLRSIAWQFGRD
jgi:hypothetical protein